MIAARLNFQPGQSIGFVRIRYLLTACVWGAWSVFCFCTKTHAQLSVRVVDVGAGLCCVATTSDGHYMIYDAGNYRDHGKTAMEAVDDLIPPGSTIDLMVLSHCDADHIAAVPFICENYKVKEVWRDGFDSGRDTWARADEWITKEVNEDGCNDINLQSVELNPGHQLAVGNATVTFLCGFRSIPSSWGLGEGGENRNARSIVVRMDHGDASILFAGDTVGRHIGDPWNSCIAAEAFLVNNVAAVPIDVDVLVAPHHGADNGSSYPFILATSPQYVIFSAGSHYEHPHFWTANRYLASGISAGNIFRTDRGDNEGGDEWWTGTGNESDPAGDDDVHIQLLESGTIEIAYAPTAPPGLPSIANRRRNESIDKWVLNDALWLETQDDIEEHTRPKSSQVDQPEFQYMAPSCQCRCRRPLRFSQSFFFRRCRCW